MKPLIYGHKEHRNTMFIPCVVSKEIEFEIEPTELPMDINPDNAYDLLNGAGINMEFTGADASQLVDEGELYEGDFGAHGIVEGDIWEKTR